MDASRVRTGEMIAGVSGAALFIILFLEWFSLPTGGIEIEGFATAVGVDTSISAWQAFDFIDLVLLLAVIAGVGLAVLAAAQSSVQLPVAASAITAGLGILGTLLVLYRVIDPPSDLDRAYGLFLGLIAVAGVAIGGWLAMQEEGTTFGGEADRFGGGTGTGTGTGAPPPPPPPSSGP
jgi:multidrug transporter EmrE-like cation transporter